MVDPDEGVDARGRARRRWGEAPAQLAIDRFTVAPEGGGRFLVAVEGRWLVAPEDPPATPVLVVDDGGLSHCFVALAGEHDRAVAPGTEQRQAFAASFSVPEGHQEALAGPLLLDLGTVTIPLTPGTREGAPSAPAADVLDPAVLADRRARRAEAAEAASARAAQQALQTQEALAAELAQARQGIEDAERDIAIRDATLAERERELRVARQQAHTERRLREEAVEEERVRAERAEREVRQLRDRLRRAEAEAREGVREVEGLRRSAAEAEHSAEAAEARARTLRTKLSERDAGAELQARTAQQEGTADRADLQQRIDDLERRLEQERAQATTTIARLAGAAEALLAQLAGERANAIEEAPPAQAPAPAGEPVSAVTEAPPAQPAAPAGEPASAPAQPPAAEPSPPALARERPAPWLGEALLALLEDDPTDAALLALALLPAQRLSAPALAVDYDIALSGIGIYRVALGGPRPRVVALLEPRPRRATDFRLEGTAASVVGLAVGGGAAALHDRDLRVRATVRRRRALAALPPASLELAEFPSAGIQPDPLLLYRALALAIPGAWRAHDRFALVHEVSGPGRPRRLLVEVGDGTISVAETGADSPADAHVRTSRTHFLALLGGAPPPLGDRAVITGDAAVVTTLNGWIEQLVRAGGEPRAER